MKPNSISLSSFNKTESIWLDSLVQSSLDNTNDFINLNIVSFGWPISFLSLRAISLWKTKMQISFDGNNEDQDTFVCILLLFLSFLKCFFFMYNQTTLGELALFSKDGKIYTPHFHTCMHWFCWTYWLNF